MPAASTSSGIRDLLESLKASHDLSAPRQGLSDLRKHPNLWSGTPRSVPPLLGGKAQFKGRDPWPLQQAPDSSTATPQSTIGDKADPQTPVDTKDLQIPAQSSHEKLAQPLGMQRSSTNNVSLPFTAHGGDGERLLSKKRNVSVSLKSAGDARPNHSNTTEQSSTAFPSQVHKVKPDTTPWSSRQEQIPGQANLKSTNMNGEQNLATNIYPGDSPPRPIIENITVNAAQKPNNIPLVQSDKGLRPLLLGSRNHSANIPTEKVEENTPGVFEPKDSITPGHGTLPTLTRTGKLSPAQPQAEHIESLDPSVEGQHSSYTMSTESLPPDSIPPSPIAQIPDHKHSQTSVFEHVITSFKQRSAANLIGSDGRPGFLDRELSPHLLCWSHFRVLKP